jgi:ribosomal protein S18 acetylase RimI-like enzyme
MGWPVRLAGRTDVPTLAAVLGRAFHDDPVMIWIIPDDEQRRRRLPMMFAILLRRYYLAHRATDLVADGRTVLGGAMWAPPGGWLPSAWRQLAALPSLAYALRRRLPVASAASTELARVHPRHPHWYLVGIGTDPPVQRRGVGGELLRSRLTRCDAAGVPAYLEASKESNVGYYERFGFSVTEEVKIPRGGPTLWPMSRRPGDYAPGREE